jgi:hypothetical protein
MLLRPPENQIPKSNNHLEDCKSSLSPESLHLKAHRFFNVSFTRPASIHDDGVDPLPLLEPHSYQISYQIAD